MKQTLIVKYISIIFVIATFMGSLHHHGDLQEHNDCQICTVQNNIIDIDTPNEVTYLSLFRIENEAIVSKLSNSKSQQKYLTFSARAPPLFS